MSPKRQHLDKKEENELLELLLTQGLGLEGEDGFDKAMETPFGKVFIPVILAALSVKMTLFVFTSFLLGPLIALLWRARRYLADATAVQLTRDPNSLALALTRLARKGGMIPGTQAIAHLFIVSHNFVPQGEQAVGHQPTLDSDQDEHRQSAIEAAARVRTALQEGRKALTSTTKGTLAESFGGGSFVSLHPSLTRRLERLQRLGATMEGWRPASFWEQRGFRSWDRLQTLGPAKVVLVSCLLALLVVLVPIAVAGSFLVVAMLAMVSLMCMGFFLMGIHGVFLLLTFLKAWVLV
jgi:hypothetical protein